MAGKPGRSGRKPGFTHSAETRRKISHVKRERAQGRREIEHEAAMRRKYGILGLRPRDSF
jgi:hypothetical protein